MDTRSWFQKYCEKTTAPSMAFFVMRQRSLIEKTFWILTFLLMIYFTTTAMHSLINVWINSPVVLFIDNKDYSIKEIPFPTITICPSNQLRKSIWEKYMNTNSSYWKDIQHYRSLICSSHIYSTKLEISDLEYLNYKTIKNVINLKDFMISCPEMLQSKVKWQNTTTNNFCNLVQPLISFLGLCYSINMVSLDQILKNEQYQRYRTFFLKPSTFNYTENSKWNLDYGYSDGDILNVYPLRSNGVSYYNRLSLTLKSIDDDFLACPNRGFKDGYFLIFISNPSGYPSLDTRSFILPDTSTKIQITPFVKKINYDLEWRSPDIRKCYLYNERKLSLFLHYTESNCYEECIMNETLAMCGCISFEWSYIAKDDINICGMVKRDCLKRAIFNMNLPRSLKECNCMPTCTVIQYEITESYHVDDWSYLKTTKLEKNNSRTAMVEFVFKHPYFTAYRAKSILDMYSLISVVGGTFGLFLGLNVLNIFEILYVLLQMFVNYIVHVFEKLL